MFAALPDSGFICIAKRLTKGFKHTFFTEVDLAKAYALQEDKKGHEVYLAQASFKTKESRKQENVSSVRSFWLDIDCGDTKPYASQGEGALAIKAFCTAVGLPLPSVVNSGNGLYAHWVLSEDVTPQQWHATANILKAVIADRGFYVDPVRTADSSSVLRPIGTHNHKDPATPKEVKLLRKSDPIPYADFHERLTIAAEGSTIATPKAINQGFEIAYSGPPSNASLVRKKCKQLDYIATNQAEIPEPLWYAMIGLVRHCIDGPVWIHDWSVGHPGYDLEATDRKIEQLIGRDIGPTTCDKFRSLNPVGCENCPHEVTSPILLGKEYVEVEPTVDAAERPELPAGFKLTKNGLVMDFDDQILFYDQELYVTDLAWDESLGYETATVKHFLPHEGWKEFHFRSSLTNDLKSLQMAFADNHVKIVGMERKKAMTVYIESYLSKIQRQRKMAQLVCQMGWKDDGRFVLGTTVILPDGTAEAVSLAKSVPHSVEAFHVMGKLAPWVEATKIFDSPNMESLAFAFCAGAFGAPLMKFTGYPGAMVAMLGPSGVGKTLIGTWMLSTYGKPERLMMLKDDTKNSLIGRLGAYGNLPLYIDEVTNSAPEELSELTYRITQGRDKARLNRNATERTINNQWQTLALISSNASIVDKLSSLKQDASPELNRVLEFYVPVNEALNRDTATGIYRTVTENYGHAGVEYVKFLVANRDVHQGRIDKIVSIIDQRTGALNEERYWSAIAGTTLYGAACALKLGLIRFDVRKLLDWAVETIKRTRGTKEEVVNTALDSLGQLLDDYAYNRLVVNKMDHVIVPPRSALAVRVETDTDFLFIGRGKVKEWCTRNHASYTTMQKSLLDCRVLLDANKRKVLGAGTEWAGSQQPCWVLDLKHPLLGKYNFLVTETAESP